MKNILILSSIFLLSSCTQKNNDSEERKMADAILNQNLKFGQLINVDSISEVTVNNNYGSVKLNISQLKKIRKEFSAMTLH